MEDLALDFQSCQIPGIMVGFGHANHPYYCYLTLKDAPNSVDPF